MENRKEIYNEKQSFRSVWLLVLLLVPLFFVLQDVYQHFMENSEWNMNFGAWIVVTVFVYFVFCRLNTTIDAKGIEITFFPFAWRKRWYWQEIRAVYVRKYALSEFGGWGYRIGRNGVAYTCKGIYGIQIELSSGRRVLIGTQRPEKVESFITKIREND